MALNPAIARLAKKRVNPSTGGLPPGLAKKPGGMPPGQYKKLPGIRRLPPTA